ncbi:MAG: TRAP transporter substrate-binding protein [Caldimonas sp.]|uniref:TRAP transporter substrate-binding protein n=1 Tax=Caldimonas sp. TaxID=2838790 RepID=UPI00391B6F51
MQRRELLLAGAGLALAVPGRAATPWRLATGYRAESFHGQNLLVFAREVATATAQGVRIELHPHNSLVPLPQIFTAATDGRIEAGEAIMTGLADVLPLAGADAVPFVVGSYEDAERLWRHQRPLVERQFAQRGLRVLYAVPWPPQGLFSRRPVQRVADLAGTRMRTYNATTVRIAQLLGAEPVDVAMVDVGRALSEGRIDTMITSAVTGVENQVWGAAKHYYDINAWIPKNIVFVRADRLEALTPPAREAVLAAARSAEARGWAASRELARSSVLELQRQGVQVDPVHPHLSRDLKRLGERFSLEWIRAVGREANEIFIPYYTQA